jgi:hypothetical protein
VDPEWRLGLAWPAGSGSLSPAGAAREDAQAMSFERPPLPTAARPPPTTKERVGIGETVPAAIPTNRVTPLQISDRSRIFWNRDSLESGITRSLHRITVCPVPVWLSQGPLRGGAVVL